MMANDSINFITFHQKKNNEGIFNLSERETEMEMEKEVENRFM